VIVSISPEAERELTDGALFYTEKEDPELGLAFIAEFERALEILRQQPNLGAPWRAMTRRFPLRRFPYFVLCVVEGTELRIIALVHQRRRPGYWSGHNSRPEP
jgi:plasmid stabilization system protein ParE